MMGDHLSPLMEGSLDQNAVLSVCVLLLCACHTLSICLCDCTSHGAFYFSPFPSSCFFAVKTNTLIVTFKMCAVQFFWIHRRSHFNLSPKLSGGLVLFLDEQTLSLAAFPDFWKWTETSSAAVPQFPVVLPLSLLFAISVCRSRAASSSQNPREKLN